MNLLLDRIIDGLNNGVIYGFLALALVCVFRGTGHINMAQGEMAMFSAFFAFAMISAGMPALAAVVVAILCSMFIGAVIERALIRPLGHGPESGYPNLLVTIGLFLILNALAGVIWGGDPRGFPSLVPSSPDSFVSIFGARVRYQELLTIAVLAVILLGLYWLYQKTALGLAMRAAASSPDSARLVGIRVDRINSLGWVLAAGVGGAAAVLVAPSTTLTTGMMFNYLIYAVAAATLGGFDSPGGAVVAGLFIGVLESLTANYVSFIGNDLKQAVALVTLVLVLVFRPTGIWGSKKVERV